MSSTKTVIMTTQQPAFKSNTMVPYREFHTHSGGEKTCCSQTLDTGAGHYEANTSCHRRCHKERLRSSLTYLVAIMLGVAALISLACFFNVMSIGAEGLAKRATGTDGSDGNHPFVDRKLYLIVIFVGLVFVVIAGIFLAAWCCKGSFENPLCCPCYVCACCGGLSCLECIGCGLCCAGVSELSDG